MRKIDTKTSESNTCKDTSSGYPGLEYQHCHNNCCRKGQHEGRCLDVDIDVPVQEGQPTAADKTTKAKKMVDPEQEQQQHPRKDRQRR